MSFEGFTQFLCPQGHYWECDVYNETNICLVCGEIAVWSNLVDITNGSYDEECNRIDGYIELDVESEKKCEHCGSVLERKYRKPNG